MSIIQSVILTVALLAEVAVCGALVGWTAYGTAQDCIRHGRVAVPATGGWGLITLAMLGITVWTMHGVFGQARLDEGLSMAITMPPVTVLCLVLGIAGWELAHWKYQRIEIIKITE